MDPNSPDHYRPLFPDELVYSAVSSKIITPNAPYKISLFVEPNDHKEAPKLLTFFATISSNTEKWTSGNQIWVKPGQHHVLTVPVGDLQKATYTLTLHVKVEGGLSGGQRKKEWQELRTLHVTKKDKSLLLHTDKPVYKPGETVKFRALVLNRDLKPCSSQQRVSAKIFDPEGNSIKVWEDGCVERGLFKNELELSSEPVLGDWRLEVSVKKNEKVEDQKPPIEAVGKMAASDSDYGGNQGGEESEEAEEAEIPEIVQTIIFSVEKYVLPKFKVTLKPPPFLTFEQTTVSIQVEAKYTYGKGLTGEFTLTPKRDYYWNNEIPKITTITSPLPASVNGIATVDVDISGIFRKEEMQYDNQIKFEVTVKEQVTGKEHSSDVTVPVHKFPYKIEPINRSSQVKPGLPFTVGFKVTSQDNLPISDPDPHALKILHGFSYHKEGSKMTSHIPKNGTIFLTFDTPTNELNRAERIEVTYKELTYSHYVPQIHDPRIKTYMDVRILNNLEGQDSSNLETQVPVNCDLEVSVRATRNFVSLNYIVQGRMEVLNSGSVSLKSAEKNVDFKIKCPERAKPDAMLIVYLVLSEGQEVMGDSVKFLVTQCPLTGRSRESTDNFLDLKLSNDSREPGQSVTIDLTTREGNSLVALRGVDQSVLLLNKPDNDINQDSIDQVVRERDNEASQIRRVWGGSPVFQLFEQVGLHILSNAKIETERWIRPVYRNHRIMHKNMFGAPAPPMAARGMMFDRAQESTGFRQESLSRNVGQREIRVRSKFPETWLWEEVDVVNGIGTLSKTVPDTLTSWFITGYSINENFGLGAIPSPLKLTVFRPFFITLNLPYSVIKGEVLTLQVLVHNYAPPNDTTVTTTTATISLDNALAQFEFADEAFRATNIATKTVDCPQNSVTSVDFIIIPLQFGSVMLNVKGLTNCAGDAVSQPLLVRPPGEQQFRSLAALLTLPETTVAEVGKTESIKLDAIFPQDRVEGADSVKMTIISDILGSSIANLDKLITLPCGCGEQNMMGFVADIVVLDYLQASHSLTDRVRSKAVKFLEKGYQRQLTYRHANASFSAFGPSDPSGSTWLTAFVARAFIQARRYITIDDQVIERALSFLANQQDEVSGCFGEAGKVIHSEMQGGSAGGPLTAYSLLTFVEAKNHFWTEDKKDGRKMPEKYSKAIDKAVAYLVHKADSGKLRDNYEIILTTFALQMADFEGKSKFFDLVEKLGVKEGGLVYWDNEKEDKVEKPDIGHCHRPWEFRTKSVAVEMTAYALLSNLFNGKVAETTPIVRWLLKQRNSNGGFVSTQDTVVGLTALAKFAELTKKVKTDLMIKATSIGENDQGPLERQVKVDESMADVLQEFVLPETTRSVNFEVTGQGTSLVQLGWTYYVENLVPNPAFSIDIKVEGQQSGILLKIGAAFLLDGESNMVIVEVNLPSGYAVDEDQFVNHWKENKMAAVAPKYKRHEMQNLDSKLQVYLESLDEKILTFEVMATKQFNVDKVAKAYVSVYDYYDLTRKAREFYEPPPNTANTDGVEDVGGEK